MKDDQVETEIENAAIAAGYAGAALAYAIGETEEVAAYAYACAKKAALRKAADLVRAGVPMNTIVELLAAEALTT